MEEDIERFLRLNWSFPRGNAKGSQIYRIFSASRRNADEEHDKLRCNASELLSMYKLLRLWAETEIGDREEVALERSSFDACCSAIDIILMAKRQLLPMPEAGRFLKRALTNFMQRHKRAYGTTHLRPKHHWMFDVAEQFLIDPQVFDQLIIERMHITVKLHADRCDNTHRYERSVLSGVTNSQLGFLRVMKSDCCLRDCKTTTLVGFDHAQVGDNMDCFGMRLSVDDVVAHIQGMGRICACINELGLFLVIVEPLRLVAEISRHFLRCPHSVARGGVRISVHVDDAPTWYCRCCVVSEKKNMTRHGMHVHVKRKALKRHTASDSRSPCMC